MNAACAYLRIEKWAPVGATLAVHVAPSSCPSLEQDIRRREGKKMGYNGRTDGNIAKVGVTLVDSHSHSHIQGHPKVHAGSHAWFVQWV